VIKSWFLCLQKFVGYLVYSMMLYAEMLMIKVMQNIDINNF